jgi:hypothetical protein
MSAPSATERCHLSISPSLLLKKVCRRGNLVNPNPRSHAAVENEVFSLRVWRKQNQRATERRQRGEGKEVTALHRQGAERDQQLLVKMKKVLIRQLHKGKSKTKPQLLRLVSQKIPKQR